MSLICDIAGCWMGVWRSGFRLCAAVGWLSEPDKHHHNYLSLWVCGCYRHTHLQLNMPLLHIYPIIVWVCHYM